MQNISFVENHSTTIAENSFISNKELKIHEVFEQKFDLTIFPIGYFSNEIKYNLMN